MTNRQTHEIMLNGIDGGNLLGFLAAIGTLRVVSEDDPQGEWRLGWQENGGIWSPVLSSDESLTQGNFVKTLVIALEAIGSNPAFEIGRNLTFSPDEFQVFSKGAQAAATMRDRRFADFIAAFGSESLINREGKIQDTALRTMSGAGHQHFIGFMNDLVEKTEVEHLRTALFETWQYSDDRPSLRWDPSDDRRYALRWGNPGNTSKSPIRTVRGANRLAVEALPLLPTAPNGKQLHTTGFTQQPGVGVLFSWPIWEVQLRRDVVRSLLSLPELQATRPDREQLRALRVVEVYRCQRITTGKYRNFTHAVTV